MYILASFKTPCLNPRHIEARSPAFLLLARKQIRDTTLRFATDSFCCTPQMAGRSAMETLSIASMVFATRYILKSQSNGRPNVAEAMEALPELSRLVVEGELSEELAQEVKEAIEKIMQVFRERQQKRKR